MSRRGLDMTERFAVVARRSSARSGRRTSSSTARSARSTRRGARASRSCSRGRARFLHAFDVLEVDGEPVTTCPFANAASVWKRSWTSGTRSGCRRPSTTARRSSRQRGTGSGRDRLQEGRVQVPAGGRTRDWLKVKTRPAGVPRRRRHQGPGTAAGRFGSLVLAVRGGMSSSTSATSAAASPRMRSTGCRQAPPLRRDTPPFGEVPKMPKVRKGDIGGSSRAGRRGQVAEWTHDGRLRAPCTRGSARTRRRPRCTRGTAPGRDPQGQADAEALEPRQGFWPDEGVTKGDLIAYHREVRRRSSRTSAIAVHDEALSRRLAGQALPPEGRALAHAGLDPDVLLPLDVAADEGEADAPLSARQRRARAALDGEHGLHRHEHLVLAGRTSQSGPTGCSSTSILRPTWASPRSCAWPCSSRTCSTRSASSGSRRRAAQTASTCSCRSSGATRTGRRASSPRSSPGPLPACIRAR